MSAASNPVQAVSSMPDLVTWVLTTVDSPGFETWKSKTITGANQVILRTNNGVALYAKADLGLETVFPYIDAKHRINFECMFRDHSRQWAGGWENAFKSRSQSAFCKIGYKGVVWQLNRG